MLLQGRVRQYAERLEKFRSFQDERTQGFTSSLGRKIVASAGPEAVLLMGMAKHGTVRMKPADDQVKDWSMRDAQTCVVTVFHATGPLDAVPSNPLDRVPRRGYASRAGP